MSDELDWNFVDEDDAKAEIRAAVEYLLRGTTGGARGDIVQDILAIIRDVANGQRPIRWTMICPAAETKGAGPKPLIALKVGRSIAEEAEKLAPDRVTFIADAGNAPPSTPGRPLVSPGRAGICAVSRSIWRARWSP